MPDAHYDDPVLAELYDITCGWREDRDFYFGLAGDTPKAVLDLGCGTGLLCHAYAAEGHDVTGTDPSPAMLDVARRKPLGDRIQWVAASAQTFRSDQRFDLIIMTGHAFQVLLTDDDIAAGLETMRRHLKPDGRAVFESRNPAIDWVAKWDGEVVEYQHNGVPLRQTTEALKQNGDTLSFEQHFHFPTETRVSTSVLRLSSRAEIEAHIAGAGLAVDRIYGDWHEGPFDAVASEEMVFKTRLA
jgi:ubiquinone/menaquinone biosynthesis C-methylase UbiE